jgi:hypothetical protein
MVNARYLPVWTDRASTGFFLPSHSRSRKPTESYRRKQRHKASVDHINRILERKNMGSTEARERQSRPLNRFSAADSEVDVYGYPKDPMVFYDRKGYPVMSRDDRVMKRQHPYEVEFFANQRRRRIAATRIQRAWRAHRQSM